MELLTYLMVKHSFLDQLKKEVGEVWEDLEEIFIMLKEITYDKLADLVGPDIAMIIIIGIGTVLLMIFLLKIINH